MPSRNPGITLALVVGLALFAHSNSQSKDTKKPKMLVFSSADCGPCQEAQPAVDAVIAQCKKRNVEIEEFDLSKPETELLAAKYRLIGTPTFVFLDKNGNEVARLLGKQTETALKQTLSALLGEPCPGIQLLKPKKTSPKKKSPKRPAKAK